MGTELGSYSLVCEGSQSCKQQKEMHAPFSAPLAAKSWGEELVFARLGTLYYVSLVQTMIKSLSCGEEIPPNKFFPVVRYLFFFLADIRTISFANTCTSLQREA